MLDHYANDPLASNHQGKASRHFSQPPLSRLAKKNAKRKRKETCYKNTEYAPNIGFNRIPRQNTHSHIILKHQSPNYYYDSANINVTIKTTISNNRNEIAMIFNPLTTWRAFFGRNWPGDWARELFKPFTDSASLLVEIEKKRFSFWVSGLLGGTSYVGVFLCYFDHLCLAVGVVPMGHFLDSKLSWKLGQNPRLWSPWLTS